jgi:hypothetical protein
VVPKSLMSAVKWVSVASLCGLLLSSNGLCQATPQKKLEVVILAVTQFKDHRWDNPLLEQSIKNSEKDLKSYFREHFPHAELHVVDSEDPENTSLGSIVTFMQDDFPKFAEGNLTLFFVLSHGIPINQPNPIFGKDLLIATYETNKTTYTGALSVAKQLFPAFAGLNTPGSTVFLFLDTCYSGAAQSLSDDLFEALAANYGLRMMVMASSLSDAQAYRATFTEALLDLWNKASRPSPGSACTDPQQAPDQLRAFIVRRLKPQVLKPLEGKPVTPIPFRGKLCMESFGAESGLFVFFNARLDDVAATVLANGKSIDEISFPLALETNKVVPYLAPRNQYTVDVVDNEGTRLFEPVSTDLVNEPVTFVPIGPAKPHELAVGFEKTADYGAQAGLPKGELVSFQKAAFATFASAGEQDRAFGVAQQIAIAHPEDSDVKLAQKLAFSSKVAYSPVSRFAPWFLGLSFLFSLLATVSSISFGQRPPLKKTYHRTYRLTEITGAFMLLISVALYFSFSWPGKPLTILVELGEGRASAARFEKLAGRFDSAADLYTKAAASPPKGIQPQSLALQAYFAYGASGKIEKAEEFRKKNNLVALERECPTCIEKEQAALQERGKGVAHEEFSSLCTVRALSDLNI